MLEAWEEMGADRNLDGETADCLAQLRAEPYKSKIEEIKRRQSMNSNFHPDDRQIE